MYLRNRLRHSHFRTAINGQLDCPQHISLAKRGSRVLRWPSVLPFDAHWAAHTPVELGFESPTV